MNLTLIKNFFLSNDKRTLEPAKVGRVLRRSFRVKRSKQIDREKRKSGKSSRASSEIWMSAWVNH
jgi:hypothetical protein